tara:strand:+ start:286 stop:531 length:246 start_codon:yes stop_codon:yes gene_type:complete
MVEEALVMVVRVDQVVEPIMEIPEDPVMIPQPVLLMEPLKEMMEEMVDLNLNQEEVAVVVVLLDPLELLVLQQLEEMVVMV